MLLCLTWGLGEMGRDAQLRARCSHRSSEATAGLLAPSVAPHGPGCPSAVTGSHCFSITHVLLPGGSLPIGAGASAGAAVVSLHSLGCRSRVPPRCSYRCNRLQHLHRPSSWCLGTVWMGTWEVSVAFLPPHIPSAAPKRAALATRAPLSPKTLVWTPARYN